MQAEAVKHVTSRTNFILFFVVNNQEVYVLYNYELIYCQCSLMLKLKRVNRTRRALILQLGNTIIRLLSSTSHFSSFD